MSRINLLTVGMTGVDMKSNPLFLAQAKKLASATNVRFVEGTLVSRPGIKYVSLKQSGKLQGEATFRPARGISAGVFGEDVLLHVVVVDGVVYSGCDAVSGPIFKDAGDVFIFQAENYLIFQSPSTSTYWWDGVTFTESPGLNEQDWNDPDMPRIELPESSITATAVDCDVSGAESGINVRFVVIDNVTSQPVANAVWTVRRNGNVAYKGLTDVNGRFTFNPVPRDYTYDIRKIGFVSVEDVPLVIIGTGVTRQWDTCFAPTVEIVGEYDVGVVMTQVVSNTQCDTLPSVAQVFFTVDRADVTSVSGVALSWTFDTPVYAKHYALLAGAPNTYLTLEAKKIDNVWYVFKSFTFSNTNFVVFTDIEFTNNACVFAYGGGIGPCSQIPDNLNPYSPFYVPDMPLCQTNENDEFVQVYP
jgi:hypothetical protein